MSACARGSARANPHPVRVLRAADGARPESSMEDKKSSLTEAENAAAFSAATLRELQTRAQQALVASREEATRLESDITRQLDELAETISRQLAADSQSLSQSDSLQAELARLADELKNSRAECQSTRSELEGARKDLAATAAKRAEVC